MSKLILQGFALLAIASSLNSFQGETKELSVDNTQQEQTEESVTQNKDSFYQQAIIKFNALTAKQKAALCTAAIATVISGAAALRFYLKSGNPGTLVTSLTDPLPSQIAGTPKALSDIATVNQTDQRTMSDIKIAGLLITTAITIAAGGLASLPIGGAFAAIRAMFAARAATSPVIIAGLLAAPTTASIASPVIIIAEPLATSTAMAPFTLSGATTAVPVAATFFAKTIL